MKLTYSWVTSAVIAATFILAAPHLLAAELTTSAANMDNTDLSDTNHERNVMAYLALHNGDSATAQRLFARIGNDWSQPVWKTKAAFDASRTGHWVGDTRPTTRDASPIPSGAGAPPSE
jgi:hypothetical protein